ncbi:MAG: hypothetical protein NC311_06465 [Muribaculaceae bacterium]|nr:hypothetical protein [Muribaculaceae bacterium]
MDQRMIELKKAYDAKQATQNPLGQLLKLSEEASELAAAINKYVEITAGYYDCKSGQEKARKHIIEEACDVYTMLNVCKLTPGTVEDPETYGKIIHRLVYKAYRFIDRLDLFKVWEKPAVKVDIPDRPRSRHKNDNHAGKRHKKGYRGVTAPHGIDIILRIPRDMSGCVGLNNGNPWGEGLEGDFE